MNFRANYRLSEKSVHLSHISKIELEIRDLQSLKDACKKLGFQFMNGQKHYQWYGKGVGRRLVRSLEAVARKNGLKQLCADVSITAMPFFSKAGLRVVQQTG